MKNKTIRLVIIIIVALAVLAGGGIAVSTMLQGNNDKLAFSDALIKETIVNQVCDVEDYVENPQGKALRMTATYTDESNKNAPCLVVGLTFKPTKLGTVKVVIESLDGDRIETTIEVIEAAPTIADTENGEIEWKTTISLQELRQYVIYESAMEPEFYVVSAEFRDQKFELREEEEFTFEEIGIYIFTFELSTRGGMATGSIQIKSSRSLTDNEKNDLTNNSSLYPDSHAQLSMSEEHAENSDWSWEIKAHPADTMNDVNGGYFKNQIRIEFNQEIDLSQYYFTMDIKASKDSGGVAIHYLTDENIWSPPMGFHDGLGEWNHISGMDLIKEGKYTALAVVLIHPAVEGTYDPENVTCLIDNLQLKQYPDPNAPIIVGGVEEYDVTTKQVSWVADGSTGEWQIPYVEFNKDYTNQTMTFTTKVNSDEDLRLIFGARVQDAEISYAEAPTGLIVGVWNGFIEIYAPKFSNLLAAQPLELKKGEDYTFAYSVESVKGKDTFYLKVTDKKGNVLLDYSLPLAKGFVNSAGSFVVWNPADVVSISYEQPKTITRKQSKNVIVPANGKAGVAKLSPAAPDNINSTAYLAMDGNYTTETFTFTTTIEDAIKPNLIIGTHMSAVETSPFIGDGVLVQFYYEKSASIGFYEVYAPQYQKWIGAEHLTFESGKEYTFHVSMKGNKYTLMVEHDGIIFHEKAFEVDDSVPKKGKFAVWTMNEKQNISYEMPINKVLEGKAENKNVVIKNAKEAGVAELDTIAPNNVLEGSYLALQGNYTNETFTFTTTIVDPKSPNIVIGAHMDGVDMVPSAYDGITVQFFDGFYEVLGPKHGKKLADETAAGGYILEAGKEYTFSVKIEDNQVTVRIVCGINEIHKQSFTIPKGKKIPKSGSFMVWNMDRKRTIRYEKPEVVVPGPTGVFVQAIDDRSTVVEGAYQLYLQTNTTGVGNTWSGWDNTTTVTINGTTECVANACWAADGLMYIQPTLPEGVSLDSITIRPGTEFVIDGIVYLMTEGYTVYYYNDGYHTTAKVPLTITNLSAMSNVTDGTYQLYLQTDATNTEAWNTVHGWDHTAQVYINGEVACTAQAIWSSTSGELFMQPDVPPDVVVKSILIKAGTQFNLLGCVYEITEDYTVYHYDGGLHNIPNIQGTPITIQAIDYRTDVVDGVYHIYLQTDATGVTTTWAGWDNTATVLVNGITECVANACWAADGLLFLQPTLPEGVKFESLTVDAGTEFVISDTTYGVTEKYAVYYYNDGFYDTPKVQGTPTTIQAINDRSCVVDGAYQVYLQTNATGVTDTWSGWDNTTMVCINGKTECVANVCWAADGLLFLQPTLPAGVSLESILMKAGTEFIINEMVYEITDDYEIYYYDNGYHNEPNIQGTPITIQAIDYRATVVDGMYQIYLQTNTTGVTTTWAGWDNTATVVVNGEIECVANACWAADGLMYLQPTLPADVALQSVTIKQGTSFVINETTYGITDEYAVYYYDGGYHSTSKIEGTPITIEAIDSRSIVVDGMYQVYLQTNATGVTATWSGWDNTATVIVNGEIECVANICWATDGLMYLQPTLPTGVTLESITIKQGTSFIVSETPYGVTEEYTVYYYDGGYHDTL